MTPAPPLTLPDQSSFEALALIDEIAMEVSSPLSAIGPISVEPIYAASTSSSGACGQEKTFSRGGTCTLIADPTPLPSPLPLAFMDFNPPL